MEHPEHPEQPDQPDQSEELDWFQQQPRQPVTPHTDADPVRTVWQLPRFRLGSRRFTGHIDHALVCVTRKGAHETFLPPERPSSVRRYVALYEVDTSPRAFQLNVPLPSLDDTFEFEVTVDITWRVINPAQFVKSQERDAPGLLTRSLLPVMRNAGRSHPIKASAAAERGVQQAVNGASSVGLAQGLWVSCTVRLRRDATERSHQARLRTARHEKEAAWPEHEASRLRETYEAQRRAEQIMFYEATLARGGVAALALHLTAHPEETQLVLEHLRSGQDKLVDSQMHLIDQALTGNRLEDYQLQEPHQLIAERMSAILRTTALSEAEDPPPRPAPDPRAVESAPPKDSSEPGA
ncbi:hypothetical protein [Streptomyces sp. NPDC001658]